ncbi:hypothetical protein G7Z17_g12994 [Cylindrodendrum hubeiense]|uniref:Sec20 C-terminal domain-containing protein n=1 Tax=Cylindrodendrum hubeiense TaxID=595255 RepID=A0A9P5LA14_9HYPO|nr:hypothetical protein G7Z17_g12994 [Cylindrodendrum hubeiense]
MSFEGLQERLTALQETTTQLKELIDRLATLKFDPGSVPLTTDEENSVSGELGAEITQALRDGEEDQELLQEEVEYFRGAEHDKERLREGAEKIGKELASCRLSFRKARLSAKNSLVQAQRLERELLVRSYSQSASGTSSPLPGEEKAPVVARDPTRQLSQQHQQSSLTEDDQQIVGASTNVTSALRRTHDLIAAELERSEYAHQTLTESSAALKQLNESYGDLDSMLASSKDLLGTLLRSQKSDTWYLQTAMYMLMVTGAWLLFRRILYGPLWWLVWLPARMLFGTGVKVGGAVMRSVPGESGKVDVGQENQEITVEGLPNKDLPTAKVGEETTDSESVLEDVEKIVDAVNKAEGLGNIPEEKEGVVDEARNTKKRMWEDTEGVVEEGRPKDEL